MVAVWLALDNLNKQNDGGCDLGPSRRQITWLYGLVGQGMPKYEPFMAETQ